MPPRTPDPTIGDRIRLRRKARGWSIRFAASRAGISHTTWSRIESGQRGADNRFLLADLARALECSVSDLTGHPLPPATRAAADAQAAVHSVRRALVETDLDDEPTGPARPIGELTREEELVTDLWRRCDFAAAAGRLPDLIRGAHAATRGPDRPAALRLLVAASYRASSAARYIGTAGDSWLAAERSRQAARELGDPVLSAWAQWARALAAMGCGAYERGHRLVDRAVDDLRPHLSAPGALEMFGMLHLTAAFAATGEHRRADAETALAEATAIASRTGETDALWLWFGPTNVGIWRVSIEVDGGDSGRAVALAEQVSPTAIDAPMRHAAYYTDLGRALAGVGQVDRALRMLLAAERIAPQQVRASAVVAETARSLMEQVTRGTRTQLNGLCERLGVITR